MLLFLLLLSVFANVVTFHFTTIDNVPPTDVSSASQNISISRDDLLVVLERLTSCVILGGRNAAYNVSLSSITSSHKVGWPTDRTTREECSKVLDSECDNFIRSYYRTEDGFVLCGTHGQRPMCRHFTGNWENPRPGDSFPGEGLSPFTPLVRAPFVSGDGRIFSVNAPEYSASADAILLRKSLNKKEPTIRTARGERVFDTAKFVAMEDNGPEVMLFFSEEPTEAEGCGLKSVTRVARVCKDDPGAISFPDEWSSFVKARLECSITQLGYDTLLFNQLTSLVSTPTHFAGVFRSQLAGPGFSAICLFSRDEVSAVLASAFPGKGSCSRPGNDALQRTMRGNPLIKRALTAKPIFVYSGQENAVAMVSQRNVADLSNERHDIFYLGTTKGRVYKLVQSGNETRHVATLVPLSSATTVKGLWLQQERAPNENINSSLYFLSESTLLRTPTTLCSRAANCSACLSTGDPQCAWVEHGADCVNIEENYSRKDLLTQDLGKCSKQPTPVEVKKLPVACLCEKPEPCVTEVIQKELQPFCLISGSGAMSSLFLFSLGLCLGTLFNFLCTRYNRPPPQKPVAAHLGPYASGQSPRASMHSCIHTWC